MSLMPVLQFVEKRSHIPIIIWIEHIYMCLSDLVKDIFTWYIFNI